MADQDQDKKPKAFRWLGPGVLHIRHKSGEVVVVPPGGRPSIVRKVENLLALGAERIEHLIKEGLAEELKIVDGIIEAVHPTAGSMTESELAEAQGIAQSTSDAEAALAKQARAQIGPDGKPVQQNLDTAGQGRGNAAPAVNPTQVRPSGAGPNVQG